MTDLLVPKCVRELDISGNAFYKLEKVVSDKLIRMEKLHMANMQLSDVSLFGHK